MIIPMSPSKFLEVNQENVNKEINFINDALQDYLDYNPHPNIIQIDTNNTLELIAHLTTKRFKERGWTINYKIYTQRRITTYSLLP